MAYIIIKHPIHSSITDQECLLAIPDQYKIGDPIFTEVKPAEIDLGDGSDEWEQLALVQKKHFFETVKPVLEKYSDSPIFYFGFAPIPLIVHLASLIDNWRKVFPMFRTHNTHEWKFSLDNKKPVNYTITGLPQDENLSSNDISLNVGISFSVNPTQTQAVVGNSLMKSILVETDEPGYDQIYDQEDLIEFGNQVEHIFRTVLEKFPNLDVVHFFASIPIPAAFVFGHKIQPNIYPVIQTYQYKATDEKRYTPAIKINQRQEEKVEFSPAQITLAKKYRKSWNTMLTGEVQRFIDNLKKTNHKNWHDYLESGNAMASFKVPYWGYLEPLAANQLLYQDKISQKTDPIADGFSYDQAVYEWSIDTSFFIALSKRLKEDPLIHKAGRLFLFHETLHYSFHGINSQVAAGIGSFPKVIEESDYQADVYALLHEYAYAKLYDNSFNKGNFKEWFLQTIHIMTETMWSFDDQGVAIKEIQIRRMNRYIMWYWQAVKIKYANTLKDVMDILSEKPVIEFSGLNIKASNQRVFYNLDRMAENHCEMAIYANGKVTRTTPPNYLQLIEGFKERNGEKVKNVLEMFYKTISR